MRLGFERIEAIESAINELRSIHSQDQLKEKQEEIAQLTKSIRRNVNGIKALTLKIKIPDLDAINVREELTKIKNEIETVSFVLGLVKRDLQNFNTLLGEHAPLKAYKEILEEHSTRLNAARKIIEDLILIKNITDFIEKLDLTKAETKVSIKIKNLVFPVFTKPEYLDNPINDGDYQKIFDYLEMHEPILNILLKYQEQFRKQKHLEDENINIPPEVSKFIASIDNYIKEYQASVAQAQKLFDNYAEKQFPRPKSNEIIVYTWYRDIDFTADRQIGPFFSGGHSSIAVSDKYLSLYSSSVINPADAPQNPTSHFFLTAPEKPGCYRTLRQDIAYALFKLMIDQNGDPIHYYVKCVQTVIPCDEGKTLNATNMKAKITELTNAKNPKVSATENCATEVLKVIEAGNPKLPPDRFDTIVARPIGIQEYAYKLQSYYQEEHRELSIYKRLQNVLYNNFPQEEGEEETKEEKEEKTSGHSNTENDIKSLRQIVHDFRACTDSRESNLKTINGKLNEYQTTLKPQDREQNKIAECVKQLKSIVTQEIYLENPQFKKCIGKLFDIKNAQTMSWQQCSEQIGNGSKFLNSPPHKLVLDALTGEIDIVQFFNKLDTYIKSVDHKGHSFLMKHFDSGLSSLEDLRNRIATIYYQTENNYISSQKVNEEVKPT